MSTFDHSNVAGNSLRIWNERIRPRNSVL